MTYPYIFHHRIREIAGSVSIVWGLDGEGMEIMTHPKSIEEARQIIQQAGFSIRERVSTTV